MRRSQSFPSRGVWIVGCSLMLLVSGVVPSSAEDPPEQRSLEEEKSVPEAAGDPKTEAPVDLDAVRAAVEALDATYNRAARERDQPSFRELLDQDVVFFAGELMKGRVSMLGIWQPLFDGKYDFRYEGERLETHVARSGDLAFTVGTAVTRFTRPDRNEESVTDSYYLNIWAPSDEGEWRLKVAATLVVHPTLGSARDPRSGLMTAWPELADQIGAEIKIDWKPEKTVRARAGDLAYTLGEYEVSFAPAADGEGSAQRGKGHFVAVWQKDDKGAWQLAAEGFTPPGIYQETGG